MRIIDKNKDFYDFYQDVYKDDTLTFDRRDSFILTKELMCEYLQPLYWSRGRYAKKYFKDEPIYGYNYLLLQICYTYWLFTIEIIKIGDYDRVKDYKIKLLTTWENLNKPRKLFNLELIDFHYSYHMTKKQTKDFIRDVDTNNYKIKREINEYTLRKGQEKIKKHIPLLKACGIANCVDALKIYLTFEEYFSLEKTASERRDPLNTTDIDKIESHGFDKKTSFRGKNK